jgi:2-polyprenyl-3-methyl-5-hydroxy-6-metoxy-1,4-benzoquinol methylase
MKKEWFVDWFASKEFLDVYSHRNSADAEKLINLILNSIELKNESKILDAACGAGRHSIILAQNGFNVTAFDLSKELLNIGKKKAEELKLSINFINADIRKFFINEKFDLVINLFTSFGYFETDKENYSFINNAFSMLNEKGWYVLDFLNKTFVEKNLISHSERKVNSQIIIENRKIIANRVIKEIQIIEGEKQRNFVESVKLYSAEDIIKSFENIGFKLKKIFGNYIGEEFNREKSERLITIFQKL